MPNSACDSATGTCLAACAAQPVSGQHVRRRALSGPGENNTDTGNSTDDVGLAVVTNVTLSFPLRAGANLTAVMLALFSNASSMNLWAQLDAGLLEALKYGGDFSHTGSLQRRLQQVCVASRGPCWFPQAVVLTSACARAQGFAFTNSTCAAVASESEASWLDFHLQADGSAQPSSLCDRKNTWVPFVKGIVKTAVGAGLVRVGLAIAVGGLGYASVLLQTELSLARSGPAPDSEPLLHLSLHRIVVHPPLHNLNDSGCAAMMMRSFFSLPYIAARSRFRLLFLRSG